MRWLRMDIRALQGIMKSVSFIYAITARAPSASQ